jgi:putative oxidoreductase
MTRLMNTARRPVKASARVAEAEGRVAENGADPTPMAPATKGTATQTLEVGGGTAIDMTVPAAASGSTAVRGIAAVAADGAAGVPAIVAGPRAATGRSDVSRRPLMGAAVRRRIAAAARDLVGTDGDAASTVLRLTLAAVMFPHGAQKLLGWFGGYGFEGTMGFLTGAIGLPWLVAALVIAIEFFGPIALALGFLSRVAAAGVAAVMVGAVLTSHVEHGFFMNWSGMQAGEGFEFHLLVLAMTAALMIRGSGALSIDRRLAASTRQGAVS